MGKDVETMQTHPTTEINFLSTNEAAERIGMKPATLRHSLCLRGHYMGLRPVKLPNRRLVWPASAIERLLAGDIEGGRK